jgi:hypothetical protein
VCLQDQDWFQNKLGIWLTIWNFGNEAYRWFGPSAIAYAQPTNVDIQPEPAEGGGHTIFDLYPGEQYTAYYSFQFQDHRAVKAITCRSWDTDLSFWWARGA